MIHADISPLKAQIEDCFLYDMDPTHAGKYTDCTLFGVSSYPGEALTFQVLVHDGSMFSYIPVHALRHMQTDQEQLSLDDLVYKNCPGDVIAVHTYDHLRGPLSAYIRKKDRWLSGTYITTIDWYEDNEQFHLVALENGQFAAIPNHKIKFKEGERAFAPYKKLHQSWKIT